jgi:phasin
MASTPRKIPAKPLPAPEAFSTAEDAASAVEQSASSSVESNFSALTETTSQLSESFRSTIEKGLAQTRAVYEKAKTTAEGNAGAVEASFGAAKAGAITINEKSLEAARAQFEANVDFIKSAMGAKSLTDLFSLQSEFARKQVEVLNAQIKEFGALAQKVVTEASEPLKARLAGAFDIAA